MKDYNKNKELSYRDVKKLYGWAISQKLLVNDFKQREVISEFDKSFIKSYNEESDEKYFFEVDVQCPENLHSLHNNLTFLLERI